MKAFVLRVLIIKLSQHKINCMYIELKLNNINKNGVYVYIYKDKIK